MGARRRLGDPEPRGGREKTMAANNFSNNADSPGVSPNLGVKAADLRVKIGCGIDHENGGGWPVKIEDHRATGGERKDMGKEWRPLPPSRQLKRSPHLAAALWPAAPCGATRMEPLGQSRGCGREPSILGASQFHAARSPPLWNWRKGHGNPASKGKRRSPRPRPPRQANPSPPSLAQERRTRPPALNAGREFPRDAIPEARPKARRAAY